MRCQLRNWLWGLLPLTLIWLMAVVMTVPGVERNLVANATKMLAGDGQDWAVVKVDGRAATLSGTAPDDYARRGALTVLHALDGLRSVSDEVAIAPAPAVVTPAPAVEPPPPAVDIPGQAEGAPVLRGEDPAQDNVPDPTDSDESQ